MKTDIPHSRVSGAVPQSVQRALVQLRVIDETKRSNLYRMIRKGRLHEIDPDHSNSRWVANLSKLTEDEKNKWLLQFENDCDEMNRIVDDAMLKLGSYLNQLVGTAPRYEGVVRAPAGTRCLRSAVTAQG
jgi:hypothetical protein